LREDNKRCAAFNVGVLHCVQDDGEKQAKARAEQQQKQIPFGNDRKKGKCKDNGNGRSRSFTTFRMTRSEW
jgi:hypothetical protein